MELKLTPAERADLRAQAHALNPVVMIGGDGLTPAVIREIDANLKAHELIKIRVLGDDREQRAAFMDRICGALDAAPVQHIGKLLVIWRPRPPKAAKKRAPSNPAGTTATARGRGPREVLLIKPSRTGRRPPTRKMVTILGNERVTAGGLIKRAKPRVKSAKKRSTD